MIRFALIVETLGCQCAGPYSQRLLGLCSASEDNRFHPNEANTRLLGECIFI